MDLSEIEEKFDTLNYVVDILDSSITHLESISSEKQEYNLILGKISDIIADLEYELNGLEEELNSATEIEIKEARQEKLEREKEFREMQGF